MGATSPNRILAHQSLIPLFLEFPLYKLSSRQVNAGHGFRSIKSEHAYQVGQRHIRDKPHRCLWRFIAFLAGTIATTSIVSCQKTFYAIKGTLVLPLAGAIEGANRRSENGYVSDRNLVLRYFVLQIRLHDKKINTMKEQMLTRREETN